MVVPRRPPLFQHPDHSLRPTGSTSVGEGRVWGGDRCTPAKPGDPPEWSWRCLERQGCLCLQGPSRSRRSPLQAISHPGHLGDPREEFIHPGLTFFPCFNVQGFGHVLTGSLSRTGQLGGPRLFPRSLPGPRLSVSAPVPPPPSGPSCHNPNPTSYSAATLFAT